jgi:hypothetical protein
MKSIKTAFTCAAKIGTSFAVFDAYWMRCSPSRSSMTASGARRTGARSAPFRPPFLGEADRSAPARPGRSVSAFARLTVLFTRSKLFATPRIRTA